MSSKNPYSSHNEYYNLCKLSTYVYCPTITSRMKDLVKNDDNALYGGFPK